jgi:hypothetical protein
MANGNSNSSDQSLKRLKIYPLVSLLKYTFRRRRVALINFLILYLGV